MSLREVLSANMKKRREQIGLSQEGLAEKAGLHRTYISDIERCSRNVSIDNIERIATAFDTNASDLLRDNHAYQ